MRRLTVDSSCKGAYTCPAVWRADDPRFLVIVGHPIELQVSSSDHVVAVRLKREIVTESGFAIVDSACRVDASPDHLLVIGEPVLAETVLFPNGVCGVADDEVAVRVRHTAALLVKAA